MILSIAIFAAVTLSLVFWLKSSRRIERMPTTRSEEQLLYTRVEAKSRWSSDSWQLRALMDFEEVVDEKQPKYPCIFATKGFRANEHRYHFVDAPDFSSLSSQAMEELAQALKNYTASPARLTPLTSIVFLFRRPLREETLEHYRTEYWEILRALSRLDRAPWPKDVPDDPDIPDWSFCFNGIAMVSLALCPAYRLRKSRCCKRFVIAMQPVAIFDSLFATPEKERVACETVRDLNALVDEVEYSPDVILGTAGTISMSNFYFIGDDNERWRCPYKIPDVAR